jgi:hypothetical protein
MEPKKAFFAVSLGVVGAFLIVWALSAGVAAGFRIF